MRAALARLGLDRRFILGQMVVLLTALIAAGGVAAIVGPPLFHRHLVEAGRQPVGAELGHIEQAYQSAYAVSLGAAFVLALVAAVVVSTLITRALTTPLDTVTQAAQKLSSGDYSARVVAPGAGPEIQALAGTVNDLAARLESTETTRRRLLADVAHELRTPLATLAAYLDGLEDEVVAFDADALAVLRAQQSRLARLADDLRDVSRAEEQQLDLHRERVQVSTLVTTAMEAARAAYGEKGVRLRSTVTDSGQVDADPARIGQVLGNVLANALRHTPAGGEVRLWAQANAGEVTMGVTDSGEGMSEEEQRQVFERFYRGSSARESDPHGSGIGLTIARAIVRAHGGSLSARSEGTGRGSTFEVRLPRPQ